MRRVLGVFLILFANSIFAQNNSIPKVDLNLYKSSGVLIESMKLDSALAILNEFEEQSSKSEELIPFYLYRKGEFFEKKMEFSRSINYVNKAYDLFMTAKNDTMSFACLTELGIIYEWMNNPSLHHQFYKKALTRISQTSDYRRIAIAHNNLAGSYGVVNKLDSAKYHYKKAILIKDNNGIPRNGKVEHNLGGLLYRNGYLNDALEHYQRAVAIKRTIGDSASLAYSFNELGLVFMEMSRFEDSKNILDACYELKMDGRSRLRLYELYAHFYELKKDYKQAYYWKDLYGVLNKKFLNEQQDRNTQELNERYESLRKDHEIDNQRKKLELQKKDLRINRQLIYLLASITLLVVLLIVLIVQRARKRAQEQKNFALQSYFDGGEAIKNTVARNLHDYVIGNLNTIKKQIELLQITELKKDDELTQKIYENFVVSMQQIRSFSHQLSPLDMELEKQPFTRVIEDYLIDFEQQEEVKVLSTILNVGELDGLNKIQKENLFGIIRETFTNISKHAEASSIYFSLKIESQIVYLEVEDNGKGFSDIQNSGIGLFNMKSRAKILGGDLDITSEINNGCTVVLSFSIKN